MQTENDKSIRPYLFGEMLLDCIDGLPAEVGGAPFNVAWHLRAFGINPYMVSRIGNDAMGQQLQESMSHWQLDERYIQLDPSAQTGQVSVEIVDGDARYNIHQPRAYDYIDASSLPVLTQNDWLYHGSLALRGDTSMAALNKMIGAGVCKRFIDVNLRDPFWSKEGVLETLQQAHIVKLNEDELSILSEGMPTENYQDAYCQWQQQALSLKDAMAIHNLLITRSDKGAVLFAECGQVFSTEPRQNRGPVNTTIGAGDAFSSVVFLGLLFGWDWQCSLDRAQDFASFIVSQPGATCANKSIYKDFATLWDIHLEPSAAIL